jgi:uncharacterized protein YcbK (DUF882 family)
MAKKMAENRSITDIDRVIMQRIRALLTAISENQEKNYDKTQAAVISTEIFNTLISNPMFMFKNERLRAVVQSKVNQFSRECRNGQHNNIDKGIYDQLVHSIYELQTIV